MKNYVSFKQNMKTARESQKITIKVEILRQCKRTKNDKREKKGKRKKERKRQN